MNEMMHAVHTVAFIMIIGINTVSRFMFRREGKKQGIKGGREGKRKEEKVRRKQNAKRKKN